MNSMKTENLPLCICLFFFLNGEENNKRWVQNCFLIESFSIRPEQVFKRKNNSLQ